MLHSPKFWKRCYSCGTHRQWSVLSDLRNPQGHLSTSYTKIISYRPQHRNLAPKREMAANLGTGTVPEIFASDWYSLAERYLEEARTAVEWSGVVMGRREKIYPRTAWSDRIKTITSESICHFTKWNLVFPFGLLEGRREVRVLAKSSK